MDFFTRGKTAYISVFNRNLSKGEMANQINTILPIVKNSETIEITIQDNVSLLQLAVLAHYVKQLCKQEKTVSIKIPEGQKEKIQSISPKITSLVV